LDEIGFNFKSNQFYFLSYENDQTKDFYKPKKTNINFTLEVPLKTRHHKHASPANR
jgi:hypothetical protein